MSCELSTDAFDNMPVLTNLQLAGNGISGAFPTFIGTTSLSTLDISTNQFSGTPPLSWSDLENLVDLNAAHNNMESPINHFAFMKSLQRLDCSFNKLTCVVSGGLDFEQDDVVCATLYHENGHLLSPPYPTYACRYDIDL